MLVHTSFFYDFEIVYFSAIFYKTDSRKTGDEKPVVAKLTRLEPVSLMVIVHCAMVVIAPAWLSV